ncbi:MAG: GIY-YIG nuclease family protein [Candidatus Doudnabacteria bacterium]
MNKTGVYLIINLITSQIYIGSSAKNIKYRFAIHISDLRKNKHHSMLLQRSWNKYTEDAFLFTSLEYVEPSRCIEREQFWIDRLKPFFNILLIAGSPSGYKQTPEQRAKSAATRRGKKRSEEIRARMSLAHKGIKLSPEHIAKCAAGHRGIKHSGEALRNISIGNRNKKPSPQCLAKSAEIRRGKKLSPEIRLKMSGRTGTKSPHSRPIICVELDKKFESVGLATKFIREIKNPRAAPPSIAACARGQKGFTSAYGFTWRYLSPETESKMTIALKKSRIGVKNSRSKPVLCVELNRTFESLHLAAKFIRETKNPKASNSSICECARGLHKSTYGFHWQYL